MNPDAPSALEPTAPPAAPPERSSRPRSNKLGAPSRRGRRWVWLLIIALLALGAYIFWPKGGPAQGTAKGGAPGGPGRQGRGMPAIPVVGAKARRGDIPVYFTALGTVTPIYTVSVKSRVDGQL